MTFCRLPQLLHFVVLISTSIFKRYTNATTSFIQFKEDVTAQHWHAKKPAVQEDVLFWQTYVITRCSKHLNARSEWVYNPSGADKKPHWFTHHLKPPSSTFGFRALWTSVTSSATIHWPLAHPWTCFSATFGKMWSIWYKTNQIDTAGCKHAALVKALLCPRRFK